MFHIKSPLIAISYNDVQISRTCRKALFCRNILRFVYVYYTEHNVPSQDQKNILFYYQNMSNVLFPERLKSLRLEKACRERHSPTLWVYQYVWYRIGKTASVNVRLKCFVQLQITLIVQRIIFLVEKSIDEKNRAMRSIFL